MLLPEEDEEGRKMERKELIIRRKGELSLTYWWCHEVGMGFVLPNHSMLIYKFAMR